MKGFKVYQIDTTIGPVPAFSRRDLCTIYLLTGQHRLSRSDQEVEHDGTCLFFDSLAGGSPKWSMTRQTGYACRFTEEFVQEDSRAPWFVLNRSGASVYWLSDKQAAYITGLFQQMLAEQQTLYHFKHELLRSYLQLVFHEALRLQAPAPKRCFRYYFRQPGPAGTIGSRWQSRPRRLR